MACAITERKRKMNLLKTTLSSLEIHIPQNTSDKNIRTRCHLATQLCLGLKRAKQPVKEFVVQAPTRSRSSWKFMNGQFSQP